MFQLNIDKRGNNAFLEKIKCGKATFDLQFGIEMVQSRFHSTLEDITFQVISFHI